jgi:hypothetical protein
MTPLPWLKLRGTNSKGCRPLGIRRNRWENNSKTDVKQVGCEDMAEFKRLRTVKDFCENCYIPAGFIKFGEFLVQLSDNQLFIDESGPQSRFGMNK